MRTLILSSAQRKWPCGRDPWVRATLRAVDDSVRKGHEIVTSIGLPSWELALWRAAFHGAFLHIVCPVSPKVDRDFAASAIVEDFALDRSRVRWHWVEAERRGRKAAWARRDEETIRVADHIRIVSVRPGGRLDALLRGHRDKCSTEYAVTYEGRSRSPRWENRMPLETAPAWPAGWLVHLTRASDGPWPGETRATFYASVSHSDEYPRTALATLERIVTERRIRGSVFRSRSGVPRVCLTSADRGEVLGLVRFRARYARYSFEPYAVAIAGDAAWRLGARPVSYGREDGLFAQGEGVGGHWRREQEWRIPGDVELSELGRDEVMLVTATETEAVGLREWCPWGVVSFGYAEGVVG